MELFVRIIIENVIKSMFIDYMDIILQVIMKLGKGDKTNE